jgi:hypothetical protein
MRNNPFHHNRSVVRGSMLVVLLLTLFTMMSFTTLAHAQERQGFRSPLVAQLQQVPSGRADLIWNPQSQALTATLHLSGLQPRSNHAAHIHAGTCASMGKILYPFRNAVADAAGNAVSSTTINHVTGGIPATGWNITVHKGSTAQTGNLLCGNVVNPKRATSVSVPLRASP